MRTCHMNCKEERKLTFSIFPVYFLPLTYLNKWCLHHDWEELTKEGGEKRDLSRRPTSQTHCISLSYLLKCESRQSLVRESPLNLSLVFSLATLTILNLNLASLILSLSSSSGVPSLWLAETVRKDLKSQPKRKSKVYTVVYLWNLPAHISLVCIFPHLVIPSRLLPSTLRAPDRASQRTTTTTT